MITAVIFMETGVVRLFDSYNQAQAIFPNCEHRFVTRPSELVAKFKLPRTYERVLAWALERADERVGPAPTNWMWPPSPGWTDADYANRIWSLAMECGDMTRSSFVISQPAEGKMKRDPGYVINVDLAKTIYQGWVDKTVKLPKQAVMIAKWFADEGYDFYTKDEMLRNSSKVSFILAIATKQDPWRILRYYTPALVALGVIKERSE